MVISATKPSFAYEDYLNIQGDDRYELIDGELILVGSPNEAHQSVSVRLLLDMGSFVMNDDLGHIYHAPFDVLLTDSDGSVNVVQPDIIFVSKEREPIITPANIQGAPDLLVEILSPSTLTRVGKSAASYDNQSTVPLSLRERAGVRVKCLPLSAPSTRRLDLTAKLDLYAMHGVKEYWIADPDAKTIAVMSLKDGRYETVCEYGMKDILVSPTLEGFSVSISSVFR